MPSVTYNYVYFKFGRHTRQPRVSNGGFVPVPGLPAITLSNVQPPSAIQVSPGFLPLSWIEGGVTYSFSFVNVSGGTGGGGTSFDASMPPPAATVGTAPIVVLVVYLPASGGNGGPTDFGATIDAFDESTNQLVNDTFVTASPDGGQTTSGNVDGWVDTTSNTEKITASQHIMPSNLDFDKWQNLQPKLTQGIAIAGANLTVSKGTNVYALAFYKSPPPPPPSQACNEAVQFLQQIIRDRGPLLPVALYTQTKNALEKCVSEGLLTQSLVNSLLSDYANIAESGNEPPPRV
jgi:hypothetical protein